MSERPLPERFLVACRNLRDYQLAGQDVPAHFAIRACQICDTRIVVSPRGIEQSARGGFLVCNPCGFDMVNRLQAAGREVEVGHNDSARNQVERILRRKGNT